MASIERSDQTTQLTLNDDELGAVIWGLKTVEAHKNTIAAGWVCERIVSSHYGDCSTGLCLSEFWGREPKKNRPHVSALLAELTEPAPELTDDEITEQVTIGTIELMSKHLGLNLPEGTTLGDLLTGDDNG